MGHRDLLVTRTYLRQTPNARVCPREASAGRLSSSGVLVHTLPTSTGPAALPKRRSRTSRFSAECQDGPRAYRVALGRMLKGVCLVQERRQAMRTMLVSVLAVLAQLGIPANAQSQGGALPAWSAVPNGYWVHPPTKRLFFFMSAPKNIGQPPVFGRPAHAPGTGGFFRPFSITGPIPQNPPPPTLKFPSTGLRPLESLPPQDFRRFLRLKNSRLYFFSKP